MHGTMEFRPNKRESGWRFGLVWSAAKEADKAKEEVPQKEEKLEAASVQEETKEETQEVEEKQELQPTTPQVSLSDALKNTRSGLLGRVKGIFSDGKAFDDDTMEELEEVLYTSDLGPKTVETLMSGVESRLSKKEKKNFEALREAIKGEVSQIFSDLPEGDPFEKWNEYDATQGPLVFMIVGVNGAGKTTSIGKISRRFSEQGKKVLIAAGDTFRAAAEDQLRIWSERAEVEIFSPEGVDDPSAVAFDAYQKAKAKNFDILIVDTAGRLHTQSNLMEELKKMKRVIAKGNDAAPHEVLLVIDANMGQNALLQAKNFHEAVNLTGVVLTKLDGTAKGGVAVGVACEMKVPIRLVGVGEGLHDLRPFESQQFVDSIF